MRTPRLALLVPLALAALAPAARADTPPSVWDKAADPSLGDHWALHLRVQRLLSPPVDVDQGTRLSWKRDAELQAEAALAMLDDAGAETSPDVRLRFDLGQVQYELAHRTGRPDLYAKAAHTLEGALALGPDAEGSTEALDELVFSYAKLDRPREELETWRRYIPRLADPDARAVDLMNMGEAEMRLGRVDDALATLREVLRECGELPGGSTTYVLTLWDMAVALDRSGDARGAIDTASHAAQVTGITGNGYRWNGRTLLTEDENVFFVPAWERYWYLALGSEALGREDKDPREALAYLTEAEAEWDQYIARATAAGVATDGADPAVKDDDGSAAAQRTFLGIARLRLDRVHAERVAAEKRVPSGARGPSPRIPGRGRLRP
jgi:tetratricopeptide (TPR) repeat protein